MLNGWFERWPVDDRERLRTRLTAKQPSDFDGEFWELYLHEVHYRLGFDITREPKAKTVPAGDTVGACDGGRRLLRDRYAAETTFAR
jgi:hypothetical protein